MPAALKSAVKPFVPEALLKRWRRFRFRREQARVRGKPLDQVFSEIYESGEWATAEGVNIIPVPAHCRK